MWLIFKLKPILSITLRQNKSFKSRVKMSHNVTTQTKNLLH